MTLVRLYLLWCARVESNFFWKRFFPSSAPVLFIMQVYYNTVSLLQHIQLIKYYFIHWLRVPVDMPRGWIAEQEPDFCYFRFRVAVEVHLKQNLKQMWRFPIRWNICEIVLGSPKSFSKTSLAVPNELWWPLNKWAWNRLLSTLWWALAFRNSV